MYLHIHKLCINKKKQIPSWNENIRVHSFSFSKYTKDLLSIDTRLELQNNVTETSLKRNDD